MSNFKSEIYGPQIAVITDDGKTYTYQRLSDLSNKIGSCLAGRYLAFVLCENSIGSLAGYLAFLNNDIPAAMLDAHKPIEMIKQLISIYQPRYIWTPKRIAHNFLGTTVYDGLDYDLIILPAAHYDIHPALSILLTTSGSTGSPKLVKLTRGNLMANTKQIASHLDIDRNERPITSLPMYYSYGLSVINSHLISGSTILLTDKSVMQREFWDFARKYGATSISGVPYTYEMLRRLKIFDMDIPSLKTMTQAGGKLNPDIVKEFVEKAQESGRKFVVMYGQTEATARMSYTPQDKALEKHASIGIAVPEGSFKLTDSQGHEITAPDTEGELVYTGPNVSMGYATCPEDLAKGDENHGVLHTGDLAKRDEDGYYYITGRIARFVKVWGNRCNLDSVEQIVKTVTSDCACTGVDDLITVYVTQDGIESQIKSLLTEKTGFNPRAFRIVKVYEIPKNTSGKTLYSQLKVEGKR